MTYQDIRRRLMAVADEREAKALARILVEELFGMSYADILCGGVESLASGDAQRLENAVCRLEKGEPLQYVLGYADFSGLRFKVAPGVLIPRPETEWLVSRAVQLFGDDNESAADGRQADADGSVLRLLDIGTGSGCIAISLKHRLPAAYVEAWDISPSALDIAASNAKALLADVVFRRRDALSAASSSAPSESHRWDAILSNPPYVCLSEQKDMDANVLCHEPSSALFVPDADPLLFYRAIADYALQALKPEGRLLFECNTRYVVATADLLRGLGFEDVSQGDDCFGLPRFVEGKRS